MKMPRGTWVDKSQNDLAQVVDKFLFRVSRSVGLKVLIRAGDFQDMGCFAFGAEEAKNLGCGEQTLKDFGSGIVCFDRADDQCSIGLAKGLLYLEVGDPIAMFSHHVFNAQGSSLLGNARRDV